MIRTLRAGTEVGTLQADAVVVGAGTVGLVVATRLARAGWRIVCLESGGQRQDEDEHPLNRVVQVGQPYAGAAHGRFRCLGGTSTRWGGALIPFLGADLVPPSWPIAEADLAPYVSRVESLFGLPAGPYEADIGLPPGAGHVARLAKWPTFARRNVAHLLAAEIDATHGPDVWLGASATEFEIGEHSTTVTARSLDGGMLRVQGRELVVCAGAIETTRLLLSIDRQSGGRVTGGHDVLGRYFHDHLSVVVGTLDVHRRRELNRLVGFRFDSGGTMRNLRFELAPSATARAAGAAFAHIGFTSEPGGGFDVLRDLLRRVQQRRPPSPALALKLLRSSPWMSRAVWWRLAHGRLLYPDDALLQVHMVIEQAAVAGNRIRLSDTERDTFGQPLAEIDWRPSPQDVQTLRVAVDAFRRTWEGTTLARLARFVPRPAADAERELGDGGGIYHPGGSTRMAATPEEGVVAPDMTLFSLPNVTVLATSVLPTGGGANPTMTLLQLGLRAVDRLLSKRTA